MYVDSTNPCYHGVKTDGKLQTVTNNTIYKYIRKETNGGIWADIAEGKPIGVPPGNQSGVKRLEYNERRKSGRRQPVGSVMDHKELITEVLVRY